MNTKTIDSTDLRNNLSSTIDAVTSGQTLIVKKRGKEQVAIIDIDTYEDLLEASNPEYLKSIKKAREEYKKGEVFSLEDVFGDI